MAARRRATAGWALALLLLVPDLAAAQVSLSNLLEAQAGNLPFRDPTNRTDLYEQLNLDLLLGTARFGVRFESDQNSEDLRTYRQFTQRYADWSDDHLRLRVGNFYTIVGRGLVHRSFELPGVVLDKDGVRSKYAFARDLDGVLAEGEAGPVALRLFSGKPNGGEFSPGIAGIDRYRGQVQGGQVVARFPGAGLAGAGYVRMTPDGVDQHETGTGFLGADPLALAGVKAAALPLYVEYAQLDRSFAGWWKLRRDRALSHALYASGDLVWGPLGLVAEVKDYSGFRFGTNDPPSLVREHTWPLLNRNTHVLDAGGLDPATGERGYQLEGSVRLPATVTLTLNLSRSDLRRFVPGTFAERFAELRFGPRPGVAIEAAAYYDAGEDRDLGIEVRDLFGGEAIYRFREAYALSADFERQNATRAFEPPFHDERLATTATRAGWGSVSLVWERTTDPEQEDPDDALTPGIQPRDFVAGIVSARLTSHHEATLFVGERRGGRACTAGTCYEVLPLKGAELRLISRF